MKKLITIFLIVILFPQKAKGDLFGGDVAVLTQILANAIQQLYQLKEIVGTTKGNLELMQEIHRGINEAMNIIRTVNPTWDPGLYKDWHELSGALWQLQSIYGTAVESPDAKIQRDADQSVAEAITLNNSIYDYTREIDTLGEEIKRYSHSVSPGGAQKLTAQSLGVMLHVLNQGLRAQATGLKLQAQTMALENKKEKEQTKTFLERSNTLSSELKKPKEFFRLPSF